MIHSLITLCSTEKVTDANVDVFRNDKISLEAIGNYDKILLSPGPGVPSEAGILLEVIRKYSPTKSILGVCLGQQAIGEVFGGKLVNLDSVYHGVASCASRLRAVWRVWRIMIRAKASA